MNRKLYHFFWATAMLFGACASPQQKPILTEGQQTELIGRGKEIVQQSFQVLSGELKGALEAGSVQNAIGYCHLKASPIVDSLSKVYDAEICRTALKFRNPENRPDALDSTVIQAYAHQLAAGQDLRPHLEVSGDAVIFYSPIIIQNPMCLLCHGEIGTAIEQSSYDLIRSKYPGDLATGYQLGDLRGVWKVKFSTKSRQE